MEFMRAIDWFIEDMRGAGRITAATSETAYRAAPGRHADDARGDDPRHTTREDVRKTLRRWQHPNTQRNVTRCCRRSTGEWSRRAIDATTAAEAVPRARGREPHVIRPRREEALAMLLACETTRERRVIYPGLLEGARNRELRGFQGATSNAKG